MKKIFGIFMIAIMMITSCTPPYNREKRKEAKQYDESNWDIKNLDHDIYVPNVYEIVDAVYTGFDVTVGPTGWPVGSELKWEVALYADSENYYARLILHEYMLWWSWDDPYIVCKIPRANCGDLEHDVKLRNQTLWDITHETGRTYSYRPYMPNSLVRHINGHTVSFGKYACKYEKYLVICDDSQPW